jgi:NAD-dependent SIR2 family protein deacetylase
MSLEEVVSKAAKVLRQAKYVLVTAGAGMGADSGLPVFRGAEGFWSYYKPFRNRLNFQDCANPAFL